MKKISLLLVSCLILTSGCSFYHIDSEDLPDNYYPSKASGAEVQYIENIGGSPHEVIGYVTIQTERRQPLEELLLRLKHEAARIGGDAITGIETDATGFWKKLPAQKVIGNAYVRAKFRASVVKLK